MKMLTLSLFVCAMMVLTRAVEHGFGGWVPSCPEGWTMFSTQCLLYISKEMTWGEAERNCRSMGANLASVHSTQDYHQIQWLILSATHQHKDKWIGGSDTEEENIWFWSDGSPFHYTNWCHGEPSNSHGREGCLQMNFGGQKCWNDERCYIHFPSICVKRG
uniref:C-type lectin domain-containing protein n=1 Tax=Seriola lalandi dorsalis TaxID=1841481 RepID=A0A3B4W986_SERLL